MENVKQVRKPLEENQKRENEPEKGPLKSVWPKKTLSYPAFFENLFLEIFLISLLSEAAGLAGRGLCKNHSLPALSKAGG